MIAALDLTGVTVVHQTGSGQVVTHGGVYPLGSMDLTHAATGRGAIVLKAGVGTFQLSGGEADEVAPGRWRLHVDHTALISISRADGSCELVSRASPPTYVSLSCRIRLGGDPRPVTVEWRGDGTPSVRLR